VSYQAQIDRAQDAKTAEYMQSIKESLTELRASVSKLSERRVNIP
jgi:hypothetical protein